MSKVKINSKQTITFHIKLVKTTRKTKTIERDVHCNYLEDVIYWIDIYRKSTKNKHNHHIEIEGYAYRKYSPIMECWTANISCIQSKEYSNLI